MDTQDSGDLDRASEGIRNFFQEVVSGPLEASISQKLKGIESELKGIPDISSKTIDIHEFLMGDTSDKLQDLGSQIKFVLAQMKEQNNGQPPTMRGHLAQEIVLVREALEEKLNRLAAELSGHHQACIEQIRACRQETLQAQDVLLAELAKAETARAAEHQALVESSNSARQAAGEHFVSVCRSMSEQMSAELAEGFRTCKKRIFIAMVLASVSLALNAALVGIILKHFK